MVEPIVQPVFGPRVGHESCLERQQSPHARGRHATCRSRRHAQRALGRLARSQFFALRRAGVRSASGARGQAGGTPTDRRAARRGQARTQRRACPRGRAGHREVRTARRDSAACARRARRTCIRRQSEGELLYAGLLTLSRPIAGLVPLLPEPQAQALTAALALGSAPPADPLAVCAATLGLLAAAADDEPVLAVVDDAQWLDAEPAQAIGFVARGWATSGWRSCSRSVRERIRPSRR